MSTKNIFWVALLVMCAMTLHVSGQNETVRQKYERLEKDADAHPTDWKKQYEAARMLIEKDSELHDQEKAGKFYERIYHLVTDIKADMPDSVFYESTFIALLNAVNRQDAQQALDYGEELVRYAKAKNDTNDSFAISTTAIMAPIMMMLERPSGGVDWLLELRKMMKSGNIQGTENTDMMLAALYEQALDEYREWASDKLMEIDIEGKTYVLIAMGLWNVEQPFVGWMGGDSDTQSLFVDENMKVYDDLHGTMVCNFNWDNETQSIVKSPNTTAHLITVTPEQRQKYVEAYRKYLSK
jgi:hypothetical protein